MTNPIINSTCNPIAYIGMMQPDGSVRYITANMDGTFEETGLKLKNFYTTEKRVDDLLGLGRLLALGSTPYALWQPDAPQYDSVHCNSLIRDHGCGNKENMPQHETCKESFFLLDQWTYLFENGKWKLGYEGHVYTISEPEFMRFKPKKKHNTPLPDKLVFYAVNDNGTLERLYNHKENWDTWQNLQKKVGEGDKTVYVFRNEKLIKRITPKNIQP